MTQNYALAVGTSDSLRLEILNEVYNPSTFILLQRSLKPGMSVLDVGCGTGIVSCEMAKLVDMRGQVTCLDLHQEQLDLAAEQAEKSGVSNIDFVCISAYEVEKLKKTYDAIYNRFVLVHLQNPERVLDQYIQMLTPGGILILEEGMGVHTMDCFPEKNDVVEKYRAVTAAQFEWQKTDMSMGRTLPEVLRGKGLDILYVGLAHPVLRTAREKSLLRRGVDSVAPRLVGAGKATVQELQNLSSCLEEIEKKDEVTIPYFEIVQVIAQK